MIRTIRCNLLLFLEGPSFGRFGRFGGDRQVGGRRRFVVHGQDFVHFEFSCNRSVRSFVRSPMFCVANLSVECFIRLDIISSVKFV